ncbi:DUF1236 domain-containing protein [Telmatospirillum siberiense]|nr:DUF1236 domain-containing protein [Telmatospirillum siberiense]
MKRILFSIVTASALLMGVGVAFAQTTTTTSTSIWTTDQGHQIREYSTIQKFNSFSDPNLTPTIGTTLPGTVTLYPLPDAIQIPEPERYSYTIINNQPVVVESTTRKVVHTWN